MATLIGTTNGETLTGGAGDDTILGLGGADTLNGAGGNDLIITGAGGSDTIIGGTGVDSLVLSGAYANYSIEFNTETNQIILTNGMTVETVTGVEVIIFDDLVVRVVGAGSEHATIQSAVNAANDGETILIAPGTYTEQVIIDGKDNLTLTALPGTDVTIKAPADVVETVRSSSGRELNAVVTVANGSNVQLQNINVDGDGRGTTVDENDGAGQANFVGVAYRNASGGLTDVDVTGVRDPYAGGTTLSGVQRGVGVQVDNDMTLDFFMQGGSIADFQKNATVFNRANLDVTGVTVTGGGAQTIIAQNGIQVLNSTGTISGNTVTGIGFAPLDGVGDGSYSGAILAYGNTELDITDNTIIGANIDSLGAHVVGIFVFDFGVPNNGGTISGNIISHVDTGIDVSGNFVGAGVTIGLNTVTDVDVTDQYASGVTFAPSPSLLAFNVTGTALSDYLTGSNGGDTLVGLGGNDVLTGGGGADTLNGGGGNDTYYADALDTIVEGEEGGTDEVVVNSDGFALSAGAEVETLTLGNFATYTETFEDFTLGAIADGENGWKFNGGVKDQQVVVDPSNAANQAFRMSSDPGVSDFSGPYSPSLGVAAGESTTTAAGDSHLLSFDFRAVQLNDFSRLEVDFGNSQGTDRNNFLVIENLADGVRVAVADPLPDGNFDTGTGINNFTPYTGNRTLVSGVDAAAYHTLSMVLKYVDGQDNDVIDVYLDGQLIGTTTTFENFRDALGGTHEDNAQLNQTDRIFFRGAAGAVTDGEGGQNQGFLFDNITSTVYSSGRSLTGNELGQTIIGDAGDNVLTGLGGADTIIGGLGVDTAVYGAEATIAFNDDLGVWQVTDGDDVESLDSVEKVIVDGETFLLVDQAGSVGGYQSIQSAIDVASGGETILVAGGTYVENVNVSDKELTLRGANSGIDGAAERSEESSIVGRVTVSGAQDVSFDGFEIRKTAATGTTGVTNPALNFAGSGNYAVENTVFYSEVVGGADDSRAIGLYPSLSGPVTIANNLITGAIASNFSGASWHRGIWSDGTSSDLEIRANTFQYTRSAINLDSYNDATVEIASNHFDQAGSGISIGVPVTTTYAGIHDNDFNFVGTDFNLQNVTTAITLDLTATNNTLKPTGDGLLTVLGGSNNDAITGSVNADAIVGNAGTDTLNGGGGKDLLEGRAGGDALNGGGDADTASYQLSALGVSVDLVLTQFNSNDALGDTYVSIENVLGTAQADVLRGDANSNTLTGGGGDDGLYARGGADVLFGGAGRDVLEGGTGADANDGGAEFDYAAYVYAGAGVLADLQFAQVNKGDALGDTFVSIEGITGSAFADNLRGDAGDNWLIGGAGNDYFYGRAGTDYLFGGSGDDSFHFQSNFQIDIIQDFTAGAGSGDRVVIQATGANGFGAAYDTFAEVISHATELGGDTTIVFDANTRVVLTGVSIAGLNSGDFIFV